MLLDGFVTPAIASRFASAPGVSSAWQALLLMGALGVPVLAYTGMSNYLRRRLAKSNTVRLESARQH